MHMETFRTSVSPLLSLRQAVLSKLYRLEKGVAKAGLPWHGRMSRGKDDLGHQNTSSALKDLGTAPNKVHVVPVKGLVDRQEVMGYVQGPSR